MKTSLSKIGILLAVLLVAGAVAAPVPAGPPMELLVAGIALVLVGGFLVGYACTRWRNRRAMGCLPADGKSA